jgi:hypothetical protein
MTAKEKLIDSIKLAIKQNRREGWKRDLRRHRVGVRVHRFPGS